MTREEAINILSERYGSALFSERTALETLIPELRENEDEMIRKWLYDYISNCPNNNFAFYGGVGKDAVLNYLEKQKERGEANFREGYLHGFEDAQKEQKPTNNSTREKIISRATSEKQVVLISESGGEAEIGWDTRSLEDAKKLLEYGLAFINKSITNPAEKQKDNASNSFDDVWDEEDCEEIIAEGQKLTPRFKELLKEVCHAWYDRGVKLAEQKAAETPQWMIDFLNDILSSCIIYDDYVRRREYQSKVLGIIKWLENQKTKTPQWMIDFLKEIQPYSINKEEYAGYAGRIEFESKILTIIKWLEGNFIQQKEQKPVEWTKLTWKDVNDLEEIMNEVRSDYRGGGIGQKSFGLEVLERFRYIKGDELDVKEQKPTEWSEEGKNAIVDILRGLHKGILYKEAEEIADDILKFLKPKPKNEWSEEDERMLSRCIKSVECSKQFADSETYKAAKDVEMNWLKSLRFQPRQNPEVKLTGWVARDRNEDICVYEDYPEKDSKRQFWFASGHMSLDEKSFPDIKWENEPVEVEITIRKNEHI